MFEVHQPDEVGGSHTGKSISIASPSAQRVPWTVLLSTRDQQAFAGKGQTVNILGFVGHIWFCIFIF